MLVSTVAWPTYSPPVLPYRQTINGPRLHLEGANIDVVVFEIPKGCRYVDYHLIAKKCENASYSIQFFEKNSAFNTDEIKRARIAWERSALARAGVSDQEFSIEGAAKVNREQEREHAWSSTHRNCALVLTGRTNSQLFKNAVLDIQVKIVVQSTFCEVPISGLGMEYQCTKCPMSYMKSFSGRSFNLIEQIFSAQDSDSCGVCGTTLQFTQRFFGFGCHVLKYADSPEAKHSETYETSRRFTIPKGVLYFQMNCFDREQSIINF
jgi:hypothetical protein